MTWGGGLTTWLASVPGLEDIEELAEALEIPRCWCESGDCGTCEDGIALELGVAG